MILECVIGGTHLGEWRGLPATGRKVRFPLCVVYTFAAIARMARGARPNVVSSSEDRGKEKA